MHNQILRIVKIGLFVSLALIFSYIENVLINFNLIPYYKIGLSQIPVILCLFSLNLGDTFILITLKTILSGLIFGTLLSPAFTIAIGGAFVSFIFLNYCYRNGITILKTSILSSIGHNIGQILIIVFLIKIPIYTLLPFVIVIGPITGYVIGKIGEIIVPRIKNEQES